MDLSSFTPDQRKAVQHLDGPLLVCAGAGTGKTFTLTQRIAYALVGNPEEGVPPFLESIDQALVITYTNKAAAELKSRFRATLRSVGRFEDALKVDGAWVSTIHGMCSRILREHALELGIDPEFKLALGADSTDALMQAIDMSIRDAHDYEKFQPLFAEYETYGVKNMLTRVIGDASCQTRGLDAFDLGPGPSDTGQLLRMAIGLAEDIAAGGKGKTAERASLAVERLGEFLENGANPDELPDLVKSLGLGYMRGEGVADLKQTLTTLQDANNLNATWDLLQLLMELARKVEANYQDILAAQSKVDTSDLIRKTLAAFDEHPEIAEQYTGRFKLIMVDEFQDTSQLQIDMIERIAGPGKPHLCTVGDSQQSIYRFQGADVGVYLRHKHDMRDSGALMVELQDNFRSNADILAFVRAVCGKPGFFVEDFLDLHAGSTGRCYFGTAPRVELAVTLYERGCSNEAVEAEAQLIAQRFRTLIDEGHEPGDMVILMGATTRMETYANALREQGIPCMAAGGSKYYTAPHVQRCLSLLRVLANPYDSESMMDVLSSDVLPTSSADLLRLSTYYNEENGLLTRQNFAQAMLFAEREPHDASPLLLHAIAVLQRAWGKLGTVRPAQLLLETLVDSGWLDRLSTQGEQGQAALADLMKMVRLVETAEQEAGFDMTRVTAAMQAASESESEAPGVLSVEGLQAVRLMTAHGSKGLEFPIVAVTSCFTSRTDVGTLRTEVESGVVYASLLPKGAKMAASPEFDDKIDLSRATSLADQRAMICEVDARRAQAERRRLFYVAATRATDALIIAMNKARTKSMEYKEVEADLLNALFPGEADFPATSGTFDYGGSEPGTFTRIDVYKEGSGDPAESAAPTAQEAHTTETEKSDAHVGIVGEPPGSSSQFAAQTASVLQAEQDHKPDNVSGFDGRAASDIDPASGAAEAQPILVPKLEELHVPTLIPVPRRVDFYSYSSIAPHDAPPSYAYRVDDDSCGNENVGSQTATNAHGSAYSSEGTSARMAIERDRDANGDENIAARIAVDADKATDFGTALHRTCEWLALQGGAVDDDAALRTADRFGKMYGVRDMPRLTDAVMRWRGSTIATQAYAFASCQPEVPFCTLVDSVDSAGQATGGPTQAGTLDEIENPAETPEARRGKAACQPHPYLEGEIDLLCTDGDGHAFIVDYKTGGSNAETDRWLQEKHLLQAQCYAYATLRSGYQSAELHFVRVERPDPVDQTQPQVVSYSFTAADLPTLATTIASAIQAARQ